jgi:cell division protein FtsB
MFRKLPEEIKSKIEEGIAVTNTKIDGTSTKINETYTKADSLVGYLAPSNAQLSLEHRDLKSDLKELIDFKNTETGRREDSRKNMTDPQKDIIASFQTLTAYHVRMEELMAEKYKSELKVSALEKENNEFKRKNAQLRQKITALESEWEQDQ